MQSTAPGSAGGEGASAAARALLAGTRTSASTEAVPFRSRPIQGSVRSRSTSGIRGLPENKEGWTSLVVRLPDEAPHRAPIPPGTRELVDRIMREPAMKGKVLKPGGHEEEVFLKHAPLWERKAAQRDKVQKYMKGGELNPHWKRHERNAYGELQHMHNLFRETHYIPSPPRFKHVDVPLTFRSFEDAPTRHGSLASKSAKRATVSTEAALISVLPSEPALPPPVLPEPVEIVEVLARADSVGPKPERKKSASAKPTARSAPAGPPPPSPPPPPAPPRKAAPKSKPKPKSAAARPRPPGGRGGAGVGGGGPPLGLCDVRPAKRKRGARGPPTYVECCPEWVTRRGVLVPVRRCRKVRRR